MKTRDQLIEVLALLEDLVIRILSDQNAGTLSPGMSATYRQAIAAAIRALERIAGLDESGGLFPKSYDE